MMPSNPKPSSGVCISRAYRGLTVVMSRLKRIPPFRKLMRPQYSMAWVRMTTQPRQPAGVEDALVGEIVNGQHGRDTSRRCARAEHPGGEHGDEARLPVVGVNHVVAPVAGHGPVERRLRQEREPLGIVRVVVV